MSGAGTLARERSIVRTLGSRLRVRRSGVEGACVGGSMTRSWNSLSVGAGALALALGICLRLWTHGNFSHFASGFLLGVSIALLILGLAQPSRRVSR